MTDTSRGSTRRRFLKQSGATVVGATMANAIAAGAFVRADETLRVALIGCGGRGTGAADQALSTEGPVKLVAVADAFRDRIDGCLDNLSKSHEGQIDVPEDRKFTGFDAYQKAIDCDVDVVILTTPPGFRPMHFDHAVQKGRHVFMEKPVAVDAAGIRQVLATAQVAKQKNLKVGVGLQRHHERRYLETIPRLQDGAIGDILLLRAYWNGSGVWVNARQPDQTEMEYQMRNWYYFNWLCGDHIVEQHIHNLDVCNWIKGGPPVEAQGQGGRQVRTGMDHGEIYDHHMVEFTYADGSKMLSQCRHIPGCWESVSEHVHGSSGTASIGHIRPNGGEEWRFRGDNPNPYQVEHDVLFAAIRNNVEHNEAEFGAHSTMTAIFGRMATYSGKKLSWDEALNSTVEMRPSAYAWDGVPPTTPDADGRYPIPMPGVTQVL